MRLFRPIQSLVWHVRAGTFWNRGNTYVPGDTSNIWSNGWVRPLPVDCHTDRLLICHHRRRPRLAFRGRTWHPQQQVPRKVFVGDNYCQRLPTARMPQRWLLLSLFEKHLVAADVAATCTIGIAERPPVGSRKTTTTVDDDTPKARPGFGIREVEQTLLWKW